MYASGEKTAIDEVQDGEEEVELVQNETAFEDLGSRALSFMPSRSPSGVGGERVVQREVSKRARRKG